jgi:8-oxo-dGTP diphosphatase
MKNPKIKDSRLAAKALIISNKKVLLVKRPESDKLKPGMWEPPGGRLEPGEDPILGLMREVREETGLYIEVLNPLSVRHFTRADNKQIITMIIFLCKPKGGFFKISDEHSEYKWVDLKNCKEKLGKFFWKEIDIFRKLKLERLL